MEAFDKLQYFVGKVCTILTPPTNRMFNDQQHANVFVGLVEEIDHLGVWIRQLTTGKTSFFAAPIIGIVEETFKELTDEELAAAEKKLKSNSGPIPRASSSNVIDPAELARDWKRFKESK